MPFTSKRQLQTCFGQEAKAKREGKKTGWGSRGARSRSLGPGPKPWNCRQWLKETKDPGCLPTLKGGPRPLGCRKLRQGEKIGKIQRGPRGGEFFMVSGIKVYVPAGTPRKTKSTRKVPKRKTTRKSKR